ncbi:hypothetical protein TNCV_2389691 [Trichonephila clavipes]|nr:hypothetical protein TNCV_2389691 [Trichonephila clavipes]
MSRLKCPPVRVVWKLREGCQLRCHRRHLIMVQNYEIRRPQSPRVAEYGLEATYPPRKPKVADSIPAGVGRSYHMIMVQDLSSNPGEDMGVCKCIVPSWHGDTINSRRAASPLMRLMEGEEKWEVPDHLRFPPSKLG